MTQSDAIFYSEISDALFGYLSDKFVIPLADMSRERIDEGLVSRAVSSELQEDLKKALDECEMVRFAPGIVRGKEEMFEASKRIIENLEHEI